MMLGQRLPSSSPTSALLVVTRLRNMSTRKTSGNISHTVRPTLSEMAASMPMTPSGSATLATRAHPPIGSVSDSSTLGSISDTRNQQYNMSGRRLRIDFMIRMPH